MDTAALYDVLNCASMAVLAAEGKDAPKAETAVMEATVAAAGAFPPGSEEAAALNLILGAVWDLATGVPS